MNIATPVLIISDKNHMAFAFSIRYTQVLLLRLIETSARNICVIKAIFDSDVNTEFRNRTAVF